MRALIALIFMLSSASVLAAECPAFLNHDLRKLHSPDSVNLCDVAAGKPMLVVNTASRVKPDAPELRAAVERVVADR